MKSLKFGIAIWAIFSLLLLAVVLLPKSEELESVQVLYAEFLPGSPITIVAQNENCQKEPYQTEYTSSYSGDVFICRLPETSPYARSVYVSAAGTTIKSAYFYLKPKMVMLGDLVAWFDRWDKQRGKRRVYLLTWENVTAYVGRGWPGLDTEIISISLHE